MRVNCGKAVGARLAGEQLQKMPGPIPRLMTCSLGEMDYRSARAKRDMRGSHLIMSPHRCRECPVADDVAAYSTIHRPNVARIASWTHGRRSKARG
jgi:hypothetical protein